MTSLPRVLTATTPASAYGVSYFYRAGHVSSVSMHDDEGQYVDEDEWQWDGDAIVAPDGGRIALSPTTDRVEF